MAGCHSDPVPTIRTTIRLREPEDIPALASALMAQQRETRYPLRDPLPFPVADFLHADDASRAWTAVLDGQPVGHVCRVEAVRNAEDARVLDEICATAHGCSASELTWVSTLFTAAHVRGAGLGRRLLRVAVDDARSLGLRPCLEVLPVHAAALAMYDAAGWRTVHHFRPDWLRSTLGDEGPDVSVMVLASTTHP